MLIAEFGDKIGNNAIYCEATDESLVKLEKGGYICPHPTCHEPVMLKRGDVNIPHFSHYTTSGINHWWEPESERHYEMKLFVRDYFKKMLYTKEIYLEHSGTVLLADGSYLIPDVLVVTKFNERIAIECQCTKYSRQKILEKTQKYSDAGVYVLWIFDIKLLKNLWKPGTTIYEPLGVFHKSGYISFRIYVYASALKQNIYAVESFKRPRKGDYKRNYSKVCINRDISFESIQMKKYSSGSGFLRVVLDGSKEIRC